MHSSILSRSNCALGISHRDVFTHLRKLDPECYLVGRKATKRHLQLSYLPLSGAREIETQLADEADLSWTLEHAREAVAKATTASTLKWQSNTAIG
jgi:hypothetical protein